MINVNGYTEGDIQVMSHLSWFKSFSISIVAGNRLLMIWLQLIGAIIVSLEMREKGPVHSDTCSVMPPLCYWSIITAETV